MKSISFRIFFTILGIFLFATLDRELVACSPLNAYVRQTTEGKMNILTAVACLDAKDSAVWSALADYENHATFMPNTIQSKILGKNGNTLSVYKQIKMTWKYIDLYTNVQIYPEQKRLTWIQTKGLFKTNEGYWQVRKKGSQQCEVTYHIRMEPDFIIPDWIMKKISKESLFELLVSIEKEARKRS